MTRSSLVRAWKDPLFRLKLQLEGLPDLTENPAGLVELSDDELKAASGLKGVPQTTCPCCTIDETFRHSRCCP